MAKIKFTRNELKAQREALARYSRFLPTLELKKMQLEMERRKILQAMTEVQNSIAQIRAQFTTWQQILCEAYPLPVQDLVQIAEVITTQTNIAGIFLPVFQDVKFIIGAYDQLITPPWYDRGVRMIQDLLKKREHLKILQQQEMIISLELRRTTQRINLFKERLMPECRENIRQIRIYLGDMQAAAVGRAKIAKSKNQNAQK